VADDFKSVDEIDEAELEAEAAKLAKHTNEVVLPRLMRALKDEKYTVGIQACVNAIICIANQQKSLEGQIAMVQMAHDDLCESLDMLKDGVPVVLDDGTQPDDGEIDEAIIQEAIKATKH
jgi:hypothetical protein